MDQGGVRFPVGPQQKLIKKSSLTGYNDGAVEIILIARERSGNLPATASNLLFLPPQNYGKNNMPDL